VDHDRRPLARRIRGSGRRAGPARQVEGRTSTAVTDWLTQRPTAWREQVQAVAIDMCTVFKAAVREALPHAMLVVDHFHVVQLASRAVTEVRRRMTMAHRGRRGRATDPEWQQRNRLTRSAARMHGKHGMIGDPAAAAGAILTIVDADKPPLRVLFGTLPTMMVPTLYADRLATWEAWKAVSLQANGG
jgi:hypothetical protein